MKKFYLLILLFQANGVFAQASFNGNVYDNESKKALKDVKLMIVEEADTTYVTPDEKGNFNFRTNPGRVKIYTVADGFISEMNSVNAGDGSTNKLSIALVKEELVTNYEKMAVAPMAIESKSYSRKTESSARDHSDVYSYEIIGSGSGSGVKYMEEGADKSSSSRRVGVLTAGEVNDFAKWNLWNDLTANEFKVYSGFWKIDLIERYCVQLSLPSGMPVIDAKVELKDASGNKLWSARTDNTGKAELWISDESYKGKDNLSIDVETGDFKQSFKRIHSFKSGINCLKIDVPCTVSDQLDIAFVVDATGSMGDEINYLKMDLDSVIALISAENKNINVRMGSVFYRDKGDEYLTKEAPFSNNTSVVRSFINTNEAAGGGDFPEAADEALMVALQNLNWSTSSRARIIFWLLDAPAHRAEENLAKLSDATKKAAEMGIKIIPIGCSGIDKSTEFLCRSIALATNGTYTFLTNHSGVGGTHIEPSTDGYKVESFREVLVRLSRLMSITPDCEEFIAPEQIVQLDTNIRINNPYGTADTLYANRTIDTLSRNPIIDLEIFLYPNPTDAVFNIKSPNEIKEVFIVDINGKLLERIALNEGEITRCDIGKYSNGVYFVQYYNGQRWTSKRIVLNH